MKAVRSTQAAEQVVYRTGSGSPCRKEGHVETDDVRDTTQRGWTRLHGSLVGCLTTVIGEVEWIYCICTVGAGPVVVVDDLSFSRRYVMEMRR